VRDPQSTHSDVIKLMNSETHSWTVSFASFAILALFGSAFFMILLILAIGRNLSCSRALLLPSRPSPSSPLMAVKKRGRTRNC
jgi:hypothetical protein